MKKARQGIEQAEFEPLADEIVIEAKTAEQVAETFARHDAGEVYLRGMARATGCIWKFIAVNGERARVWHEAMKRKKAGEIVVAQPAASLFEWSQQ